MPDPATPTAPEVPAGTPTAAPTAPETPSAAQPPTQSPDHGRINPEDFNHPEFGARLKNAHEGMTKAQAEANEAKQARKTLEANLSAVRQMIQEDPAVAAAMVKNLESKGHTVPPQLKQLAAKAAAQQVEDDDDTRPVTRGEMKEWERKMAAELGGRDTVNDFMREAGGGDVAKGSAIYHKDGKAILDVMEEYGLPATTKSMTLAHTIVTQRQAASRPTGTTPAASADSDMGRANGATPAAAPVEGVPTMEQWLANAGFSSQAEFERSMRGG